VLILLLIALLGLSSCAAGRGTVYTEVTPGTAPIDISLETAHGRRPALIVSETTTRPSSSAAMAVAGTLAGPALPADPGERVTLRLAPTRGSAQLSATIRDDRGGIARRINVRGFTASFAAPATAGRYGVTVLATVVQPGSTTRARAKISLVVPSK
jgi:hypothetical protein